MALSQELAGFGVATPRHDATAWQPNGNVDEYQASLSAGGPEVIDCSEDFHLPVVVLIQRHRDPAFPTTIHADNEWFRDNG